MTITMAISTKVKPAWEFLIFFSFIIFPTFVAKFTKYSPLN